MLGKLPKFSESQFSYLENEDHHRAGVQIGHGDAGDEDTVRSERRKSRKGRRRM